MKMHVLNTPKTAQNNISNIRFSCGITLTAIPHLFAVQLQRCNGVTAVAGAIVFVMIAIICRQMKCISHLFGYNLQFNFDELNYEMCTDKKWVYCVNEFPRAMPFRTVLARSYGNSETFHASPINKWSEVISPLHFVQILSEINFGCHTWTTMDDRHRTKHKLVCFLVKDTVNPPIGF